LSPEGSGSRLGGARLAPFRWGGGIQGRWIAAMAPAGARGFTGLLEDAQLFAPLLFVRQALEIDGLLPLLPVARHQIVAGPQPGALQLLQ